MALLLDDMRCPTEAAGTPDRNPDEADAASQLTTRSAQNVTLDE
jgi:hypothetical protein